MPVSMSIPAGAVPTGSEVGSGQQNQLAAMPPYDQLPYYAIPVETPFTVGAVAVKVLKADPLRVRAVLSANLGAATASGSGVANASINPTVNANNGIPLTLGGPTLIISWELWGPLVQQAWYAIGSAGVTGNVVVTAQEVRLIRWPGLLGDTPMIGGNNVRCTPNPPRRAYGNSVVNGINGNRLGQPAPRSDSDIRALIESCQRGYQYGRNANNWLAPDSWRFSPSAG